MNVENSQNEGQQIMHIDYLLMVEARKRIARMAPSHIIFASGGNDSVALVQYVHDLGIRNVLVAYSNTGWAAEFWPARIDAFREFVARCGYAFAEVSSEGMIPLVDRKKGWPGNGQKFCTYELKIKPACIWMDTVDPYKEAICLVGVRREESPARMNWPEHVADSENHGGRDLWSPLVRHLEADRDALIIKSGLPILAHRSKECFPCVNSNRADFRMLAEHPERIEFIASKEKAMGEKRNMFRPERFHGATGIEQVVRWAAYSPGQYIAGQNDFFDDCGSGMCGT